MSQQNKKSKSVKQVSQNVQPYKSLFFDKINNFLPSSKKAVAATWFAIGVFSTITGDSVLDWIRPNINISVGENLDQKKSICHLAKIKQRQ